MRTRINGLIILTIKFMYSQIVYDRDSKIANRNSGHVISITCRMIEAGAFFNPLWV